MPSLTFVLPHWLYWTGLVLFPLAAMFLARRSSIGKRGYSVALGYMILVTGGMVGLHRLYLRNLWGLLYIPVFIFILYANATQRDARVVYSDAANLVSVSQATTTREKARLAGADAEIARLQQEYDEAEEGNLSKRTAELKLERAKKQLESRKQRIADAETDLAEQKPLADAAGARFRGWGDRAFWAFIAILAGMAIDAVLLPSMIRAANRRHDREVADEKAAEAADPTIPSEDEVLGRQPDEAYITTGWTGAIDRLSYITGEFVSYWSVIAVFVYYYEVVARYVFNSPTIWAHEGMYLMFGMQYLICGAYAMLTENHVRVDVFYAPWSPRGKAIANLLTSVFFFIFAGVLLVTSWIFAMDATRVSEVSFTDWRIAYWPMKWAMVVGALLLALQGVSKFAQDIRTIIEPAPKGA